MMHPLLPALNPMVAIYPSVNQSFHLIDSELFISSFFKKGILDKANEAANGKLWIMKSNSILLLSNQNVR